MPRLLPSLLLVPLLRGGSRAPLSVLVPPPPKPTTAASTSGTAARVLPLRRSFCATPRLPRRDVPHPHRLPQNRKPLPPPEVGTKPPPYPFGPRLVYKQSNRGLYGLARPQHGNTVAPEYGNKSRRRWKPNVHRKRFYSRCLKRWVRTRVTSQVLRTIDKLGGIDEYLLGDKTRRIRELGPHGWKLRWIVMRSVSGGARVNALRRKLKVPANHGERELELRRLVAEMEARRAESAEAVDNVLPEGLYGGHDDMGQGVEDVYEDPALEAEVNDMLDKEHEFELGDPTEMGGAKEGGRSGKQKV